MEMLKSMKDLGEGVARSMKPERSKGDDEMYCLSLVPKMKELDSITMLKCQAEMNSVLVKYLKAMKRNAFSTTPVRIPDYFDSTIHHTPSYVGPSVSSPHDVYNTNVASYDYQYN
ncbi:hypothetical protein RRG08_042413 [Elysia crispata]|uniref:Uncharacterized protein n=1 Tax=Elysia crispata TaxID=231223 RepID=A0AAE1DDF0_9GAST|nr:hypothetical protein RRG08_042413 [Elysia crispata]